MNALDVTADGVGAERKNMINKIYLAMREAKIPYNLQLFAEDGDGAGDDNGGGTGENGEEDQDNEGEEKLLTFEEFLKGKGNQAEFDRRVQKAIDTAVSNAQKKWQALTDDKLSEAEKLSKMSKDERAEYQRTKERKEFEAEKAAFEKEKLLVAVKEDLQKQSLPIAFAESLAQIADAEKIKEAISGIKESWDAEIQEAIKAKARQGTPFEGGASHRVDQITNVSKLAREARIIK